MGVSTSGYIGMFNTIVQNPGGTLNNLNTDVQVAAIIASNEAAVNPAAAPSAVSAAYYALTLAEKVYSVDQSSGDTTFKTAFDDSAAIVGDSYLLIGDVLEQFTATRAAGEAFNIVGDGLTYLTAGFDTANTIQTLQSKVFNLVDSVYGVLDGAVGAIDGTAAQQDLGSIDNSLTGASNELTEAAENNSLSSQDSDTISNDASQLTGPVGNLYGSTNAGPQNLTETVSGDSEVVTGMPGSVLSESGTLSPDSTGIVTIISDVENADGSSIIATFGPDGSITTSYYTGPNGTGTETESDNESSNGTSQITIFSPDGSSVSTNYSGPNGSGISGATTITFGSSANPATVTFDATNFVFPTERAGGYATIPTLTAGVHGFSSANIGYAGGAGIFGISATQTGTSNDGILTVFENDDYDPGNYQNVFVPVFVDDPDIHGNLNQEQVDLNVSAKIYAPAQPDVTDIQGSVPEVGDTVNFGVYHVGDAAGSWDLSVTNEAGLGTEAGLNPSLIDSLEGSITSVTSSGSGDPFSISPQITLAGGASGLISASLSTSSAGLFLVSGTLSFLTHDSELPDAAISASPIMLTASVYNYADPQLTEASGPGSLTETASGWTLDLGGVAQDSDIPGIDLSLTNAAPATYSDELWGSWLPESLDSAVSIVSDPGFFELAAGGTDSAQLELSVDTSVTGSYTETFALNPYSYNNNDGLPYDDALATRTLTITGYVGSPSCYRSGTRLQSARGEVEVESLRVGDEVNLVSGGMASVVWIGWVHVDCARHPQPRKVWPVCVTGGAFGPGLPCRDLFLSPDHAVMMEGVLIPVRYLENGTTISQVRVDDVKYYHIELQRHGVIRAEGLPCESYLETGGRSAFANSGGLVQLHPHFGPGEDCEAIWEAAGCAPLRIYGDAVDRVAARLRHRATKLGHAPARGTAAAGLACASTIDVSGLLWPLWYLAANRDVARAGVDAATHYANYGWREGRLPCPEVELVTALGLVDPATVAFTMPDVVEAGVDPVEHFCHTGWRERRRPNPYFDTGWYSDTHGVPDGMNPLVHYVLRGERQGLPPSPHFDPSWYRKRYAIGHTESPLAHYLKHRRAQCFSPLPTFDVAAYAEAHAATLMPARDPYAHFLAIGRFATEDREQAASMAA